MIRKLGIRMGISETDAEKICKSIDNLNETLKSVNKNLELLTKLEAQRVAKETSQVYNNVRGY